MYVIDIRGKIKKKELEATMDKKVLITASTRIHFIHFHLPYINAFREMGWQVDVACADCAEPVPGAHHSIDIPFEKKMTAPGNFRAAKQLRSLIQKERYDLLICHTSLAAFFSRFAVMGMKNRPQVCNMVHGYLFDDKSSAAKRLILSAAEVMTAPVTDLLLTMNAFDMEFAKAHKLGKRIDFVNGIGLDQKKLGKYDETLRQSFRKELGVTDDEFLLVYAAEFSKRKDQMTLIRALPKMDRRIRLALPGRGALLEECKNLAKELKVETRVLFPGYDRDMKKWYMAADAAVSTSRSEGLPFNIMEAMHYGLPIIATQVKGHTDLLKDGVSGLLFPYGDSEALAQQANKLVSQPEFAGALGQTAAGEVALRYLENVLPEVMKLYTSI